MCVLGTQWLFATLWTAAPGSSVHGIFSGKNTGVGCHFLHQGSSRPRDWTQVSSNASRRFTLWATREAPRLTLGEQKWKCHTHWFPPRGTSAWWRQKDLAWIPPPPPPSVIKWLWDKASWSLCFLTFKTGVVIRVDFKKKSHDCGIKWDNTHFVRVYGLAT